MLNLLIIPLIVIAVVELYLGHAVNNELLMRVDVDLDLVAFLPIVFVVNKSDRLSRLMGLFKYLYFFVKILVYIICIVLCSDSSVIFFLFLCLCLCLFLLLSY